MTSSNPRPSRAVPGRLLRRVLAPLALAALLVTGLLVPASAITGGRTDGDGHPYTALLLVPGTDFCTGTLISEDTILTAGHCTDFWDYLQADAGLDAIQVTFDPQAVVGEDFQPAGGTWHTASAWETHPDYNPWNWPNTYDYGLLYLDAPVDIRPAALPEPGALTPIVNSRGQPAQRFETVGYGVQGTQVGNGTPRPELTWTRKVAVQRYATGSGGPSAVTHETMLKLNAVPSPQHGAGCGGDSGAPILFEGTDTVVAIFTGGYTVGRDCAICGRIASQGHRLDLPDVRDWITAGSL